MMCPNPAHAEANYNPNSICRDESGSGRGSGKTKKLVNTILYL